MFRVKILGTRGSMPISDGRFIKYGGSTTSVLVECDNKVLILDAGTGILNIKKNDLATNDIHIIITHSHIDHLLGLAASSIVLNKNNTVTIYSKNRNNSNIKDEISRFISPPLWPVTLAQFPADINYKELEDKSMINNIRVEALEGNHPGGVSILKIIYSEKSFVFATDMTLDEEFRPKLKEFAKGCDLLVCDGQYTDEEWPSRCTFGHNTWKMAQAFGKECGAKRTLITHHDPYRTDKELDFIAEQLDRNTIIAKEGASFKL